MNREDLPNNAPIYGAYAIEESAPSGAGQESKSRWHKIGVGWEHRDGKGINIQFHALPIDKKMTLRLLEDIREGASSSNDLPQEAI